MAKEYSRTQRVAQTLKKELAQIIQREIDDNRLGMVTISDVEVSRDLAYAKVFVTFFCVGEQTPEQSFQVLQQHAKLIRQYLGKHIRLRLTPELRFVYDTTLVEGIRLTNVIHDAVRRDEAAASANESEPNQPNATEGS